MCLVVGRDHSNLRLAGTGPAASTPVAWIVERVRARTSDMTPAG